MREPREHLKTLQRRVDFLKSRDHKNSFDHAELGSLEWALVNLQTERKPLTDEQIDAAIKAWFENEIVAGRQPFAKRMRAAIEAAHGIKENT
jgi:hypothetical protein